MAMWSRLVDAFARALDGDLLLSKVLSKEMSYLSRESLLTIFHGPAEGLAKFKILCALPFLPAAQEGR